MSTYFCVDFVRVCIIESFFLCMNLYVVYCSLRTHIQLSHVGSRSSSLYAVDLNRVSWRVVCDFTRFLGCLRRFVIVLAQFRRFKIHV